MALKKYGVRTVNNQLPDPVTGNVTVPTIGPSKFGKDDVSASEDREFDATGHTFKIKGATEFNFQGEEQEGLIPFNSLNSSCYLSGEGGQKYIFIENNSSPFVTLGDELTVSLSIDGVPQDVLFVGQVIPEVSNQILLAADPIVSTTRLCLGHYGITTVTDFKVDVVSGTPNLDNIAYFDGKSIKKGKVNIPEEINNGTEGYFTKYNTSGENIENSSLRETSQQIISNKDVKINQDLEISGETTTDGGIDDKSGLRLKRLRNIPAIPIEYAITGSGPEQMVYDSNSNLFVTNQASNNISKILPDGTSSIFASVGLLPYKILIDDDDILFVCCLASANIYKILPDGTTTVFSTTGVSNNNVDMEFDSLGNIFVCGSYNKIIYKILPDGTSSIFATMGTPDPPSDRPISITIDGDDNIYVSCQILIKKVTSSGIVSDFLTGLSNARDIVFRSDNYLYIGDNLSILKCSLLGVSTIFATIEEPSSFLNFDNENNLFISCSQGSTGGSIWKITPDGEVEFYCKMNLPQKLIFNSINTMYAASSPDDKIYIITPVEKQMLTLDSLGRVIFFEEFITHKVINQMINAKFRADNSIINFDGVQTIFDIPHTLGIIPKSFNVTFDDTTDAFFTLFNREADINRIRITFDSPPIAGSGKVQWQVWG